MEWHGSKIYEMIVSRNGWIFPMFPNRNKEQVIEIISFEMGTADAIQLQVRNIAPITANACRPPRNIRILKCWQTTQISLERYSPHLACSDYKACPPPNYTANSYILTIPSPNNNNTIFSNPSKSASLANAEEDFSCRFHLVLQQNIRKQHT